MCQANFDLFIITPYGDYQRLIENAPSRFKETGGFEWACIFKSGSFLFRDLILRRSAAVPMLLPKSYFQCCIDTPGLPGKL